MEKKLHFSYEYSDKKFILLLFLLIKILKISKNFVIINEWNNKWIKIKNKSESVKHLLYEDEEEEIESEEEEEYL